MQVLPRKACGAVYFAHRSYALADMESDGAASAVVDWWLAVFTAGYREDPGGHGSVDQSAEGFRAEAVLNGAIGANKRLLHRGLAGFSCAAPRPGGWRM